MTGELAKPHSALGTTKKPESSWPEILSPEKFPFEVVAEQSFRAEERDEVFAVGRGGWIRVAGFRVALAFGHAFVRGLFPEHAAIALVETPDLEGMFAVVVDGFDVAVEADLQIFVAALAHGGGDEDAIAPNDWARKAESRGSAFSILVRSIFLECARRERRRWPASRGIAASERWWIGRR